MARNCTGIWSSLCKTFIRGKGPLGVYVYFKNSTARTIRSCPFSRENFVKFTGLRAFSVIPQQIEIERKDKMSDSDCKHLYSAIQPYNTGFLEVSNVHKLYYEESGHKDGIPVLFVHGGPGGGVGGRDRRYFDPKAYRIILFDQRGAGQSTPSFSLEENDTWSLVADIEKLRQHLGIEKWVVFGGSWGSTLALVYAETHIDRVMALVLRGIFTLRKEELAWFYQEGASYLFPDKWEEYVAPIPEEERGDFIKAYYKRLTGDNEKERLQCAKAWSTWEMATSQLRVNEDNLKRCADDTFSLAFARIECHYFINVAFQLQLSREGMMWCVLRRPHGSFTNNCQMLNFI